MNTYAVRYFPEGWSATTSPDGFSMSVTAQEFTTTEDYVVFVDDSMPPRAVLMVPFSVNPVVERTATAVSG